MPVRSIGHCAGGMQCSVDFSLVEVHVRKWDAQGEARKQDRHVVHAVLARRGRAAREQAATLCSSISNVKRGGNAYCHCKLSFGRRVCMRLPQPLPERVSFGVDSCAGARV